MKAQRGALLGIAVLLLFLQVLEIKGAIQKTTHGRTCISSCVKGEENKYWCDATGARTTYGARQIVSHCSPSYKTTYFGNQCSGECQSYVGLYYYCYTTTTSWDYCGPTTQ